MKLLNAMMSRIVQVGTLRIVDAEGNEHVHQGKPGPSVTIRLTDPKLYRRLFFNPELRAGEAYMDGTLLIEEGSIRDLLMIYALNRLSLRGHPLQKLLRGSVKRVKRLFQRNTLVRSRENVAHHYDISNDLYRLFLDEDMNYSCAYFADPADSLETAQQNKLRHVASKLALKPGMRVLDIGCGWGGMALYMAKHFDVEVVGVTLSTEQRALAVERAKARGLEHKVKFELMDYRNVEGPFDRIVSIGMFEHVGVGHYDEFFGKAASLLTDDGVMLLHSIGRKGGPGATAAWVRKYIFPGGYSPALSETLASVERCGLWVTDIEILRLHYAETLKAWDARFQANRAKAAALFDERFCRMWEFYLIVCEFGFRYGKQVVFQMQLTKEQATLPIVRDYITETEASLRRRERMPEAAE